ASSLASIPLLVGAAERDYHCRTSCSMLYEAHIGEHVSPVAQQDNWRQRVRRELQVPASAQQPATAPGCTMYRILLISALGLQGPTPCNVS
ncbi:hypothetical protein HaLaN_24495, partial [Haematococcus lacustris]